MYVHLIIAYNLQAYTVLLCTSVAVAQALLVV